MPPIPRPPRPLPVLSDHAEALRQARLEREAAALRDNLRRRKQQAHDRTALAAPAPPDPDA